MKKFTLSIITLFFLTIVLGNPLRAQTINPSKVEKSIHHDVSPPVRDMKSFVKQDPIMKAEVHRPMKPKALLPNEDPNYNPRDPFIQEQFLSLRSSSNPSVPVNFEGIGRADIVSKYFPPDTHGDVGPNHYVQAVNAEFKIWDKQGNVLVNNLPIKTLFAEGGFDDGQPFEGANPIDPVVLYDEYADRWLMAGFTYQDPYFYMLIAVSTSPDPTGNYNRYAYEYYNVVPDYEKFGVWHDGLYMTTNNFPNGGAYAEIRVFDWEGMKNGDATVESVVFPLGTSYFGFLPADADGLAPPDTMPHTSLAVSKRYQNTLDKMTTRMNWDNTSNSTVTIDTIHIGAYAGGNYARQPGNYPLDALSPRLMYRLQYRNFGTHHSLVVNQTVRNTSTNRIGVRWYEMRDTGDGFGIYQQGTILPDDNTDRWMGSIAMNGNGDIALGYSVTNTVDIYPSIRFTGQTSGAPGGLGVMDLPETNIVSGTVTYTGGAGGGRYRWGDYSMMSVDPSDDYSFWYTQEYSTHATNWVTRIAKIDLDTPFCGTDSDTVNLVATSCDPSEVGVTQQLLTNQFGCDSLVITTTTLLPSDTTNIAATSCDPAQVGITQQLLTNQYGCDSLVVTTTTLLPSDTTNLDATTCDPAQVGITQQLFNNQFGCDSLVVTTTTLLPSDTTNLAATTCDPSQVGVTQQLFTNQFGCDSLVITTTTFEDNGEPLLTVVSTPITLWPPNHKYEIIDLSQLVVSVSDGCADLTIDDVYITSVSSDEAEDAPGGGDGKTKNDIVIGSDCASVDLRKERSGNGNGRVYTINLAVDDGNGNTATSSCQVHVPHNNGGSAFDDGIAYEEECDKSSIAALAGGNVQLMNYPNPFNGSTTISFTITETENTTLKVYDTFGKEVATLFDGMAESGQQYLLEFKGENLSKGIYVYHLQSGNNVSVVKKMILMK